MNFKNARLIAIVLAALGAGSLFGMLLSSQAATAADARHPQQQPPAGKHEADEDDEGGDSAIKLEDAPKPVQAAIAKITGGKAIKELSKETDEGITTYEAVWEVDGQTRSADLSGNGDVLAMESSVKADALPRIITDLLAKHHPNATIKQAEMVQETYYEIVFTVDGKSHAVAINAAGALQGGGEAHHEEDEHKEKGEDHDDD